MTETNRIEYKRELTSELDIEKEVVAFLNYKEGGYIYIGIDKDGSIMGVNETSAGRLPESLSREEFFNGISIPRHKELMRIYRDVELVESLGSGIPRILRAYGEDCFKFTDNFIRITLPISVQDHASDRASDHASDRASDQVKRLLFVLDGEMERTRLQELLAIKNRDYFRKDYLVPAIKNGYVELTIPDKPNSQHQKYRLTGKGLELKKLISGNDTS